MSNFLLIDGASDKYFVPSDFEFDSVTNVHYVNTRI